MRLAHHASLVAGGLAGVALAGWLGVPLAETLLLVAGAGAMALAVVGGLAEDAADRDGRPGVRSGQGERQQHGHGQGHRQEAEPGRRHPGQVATVHPVPLSPSLTRPASLG